MIEILVVDDRYLIQEAIKAVLKDEPNIEIVGVAKDGQEAIAKVEELQPDIVLLDIEMPKINGIVVTKYINRFLPAVKVIILSSHEEESYISQALKAGASSYLLKQSLVEDLKRAIYSLSRGYSYIEVELLNQALNKIKPNNIGNSQSKAAQNPKHYQNIQIRANNTDDCSASKNTAPPCNSSISKIKLSPRFKASHPIKIITANKLSVSLPETSTSTKANQQKRISSILSWWFVAIASFVISILIFK